MKVRKIHAAWAVRFWVLGTVLLAYFMSPLEIVGWLALGGVLALVWKRLPEEPEAPVEPLPYAHLYKDRQIPRPEPPEDPGSPPPRG